MSYEWHATFALQPGDREELRNVVEGKGRFSPVSDLYARLQLLAQSTGEKDPEGGWNKDAKGVYAEEVALPTSGGTSYTAHLRSTSETYAPLGFATPRLGRRDLTRLPTHSFFLYVPFTLATPYISKDDEPLYVHENPVRKDHVIRVPMVSGTSWKGAFRAALRWRLEADDEDADVVRLMGNAKGAEEDFRRARLHFYPTFFDALRVGTINPHGRESGAGTKPIYIEQVPRGAEGTFAVLYAPVVPDGPREPLPTWEEALHDLEWVGKAAYVLLTQLGFGAKTASGMGRVRAKITGAYLLMQRGKDPDAVVRVEPVHVRTLTLLRDRVEEGIREAGDE
jgi:CRISPR-associated protein Cmr2